jgi:hypothetical protein
LSTESRKGQEKKRRSKAEVVRQEEVLGGSSSLGLVCSCLQVESQEKEEEKKGRKGETGEVGVRREKDIGKKEQGRG